MKKTWYKIITAYLIMIFLLGTNVALAVTQSDINKQQQQQDANNNKKKELEEQEQHLKEIKDEALREVEKLNTQINSYQNQIDSLDEQISDANVKIADAEKKLDETQKEYEEKQELLKKRLIAIYESGETTYLDFLLTSSSLADFISKYYLVSEVAEMDKELIEKLEAQKIQIENSKKEIEANKQTLVDAKSSKETVANELKTTKTEKDKKVSQLSQEEQAIQKQIEEIQQENIRINKKIKEMQAELERIKNQQQSSGTSTSGTSSAGFIKPVNSYITTGLYYSSGSYHGAVDYGASNINGAPVFAVADGIVVTTQALTTSYGNYIIIYHPSCNLYTLYAHGQPGSIRVSELQTVKQGQQIMNVGSTGNSTGPHLHFEVRTSPGYYSNRVDPRPYLPK